MCPSGSRLGNMGAELSGQAEFRQQLVVDENGSGMFKKTEEERARKNEAKAQKQQQKADLRDEKRAAKAALDAETLGKTGVFRFFKDGTATYLTNPRARVLDTHYFDGRNRKSTSGRGLAALATGGLSLAASNNAGYIKVTVVTDQWTATIQAKDEGSWQGNPTKIHGLAMQAKALGEEGTARPAGGSVPRPPLGPKMWADDPFGRHQKRYFDGYAWTKRVANSGEQSEDAPSLAPPAEYDGKTGLWADDPFGRYQYRFFDASGWTDKTSRNGEQFEDAAAHLPPTSDDGS